MRQPVHCHLPPVLCPAEGAVPVSLSQGRTGSVCISLLVLLVLPWGCLKVHLSFSYTCLFVSHLPFLLWSQPFLLQFWFFSPIQHCVCLCVYMCMYMCVYVHAYNVCLKWFICSNIRMLCFHCKALRALVTLALYNFLIIITVLLQFVKICAWSQDTAFTLGHPWMDAIHALMLCSVLELRTICIALRSIGCCSGSSHLWKL